MKTIETTLTAGPDRLLRLTIPVEEAYRSYRMVILLAPEGESISGWRADRRAASDAAAEVPDVRLRASRVTARDASTTVDTHSLPRPPRGLPRITSR